MNEKSVKFDGGKPQVVRGVLHYFPRAILEIARVSEAGANKYEWDGWKTVPDGVSRYTEAMGRHLLAEAIEGPLDSGAGGTRCLHAAQVAWNALARLELALRAADFPQDPDMNPRPQTK